MTKKVMCYFLIGAFLIGGVVIASNMGFKLVYQVLTASGNSGTNWVSVPYNFPFANAQELYTDVPNCTEVTRFVRSDDSLQTYLAGKGAINFPIEPGIAYSVKTSADTNYVSVGSHDPSHGVGLEAASGNSGTNWISVPYHTTANNAQELYMDVLNCTEVTCFVRSDDSLQTYLAGKGAVNFPITPGEGLIVKVSANSTWTPSHY
jgi:hypothetical protein